MSPVPVAHSHRVITPCCPREIVQKIKGEEIDKTHKLAVYYSKMTVHINVSLNLRIRIHSQARSCPIELELSNHLERCLQGRRELNLKGYYSSEWRVKEDVHWNMDGGQRTTNYPGTRSCPKTKEPIPKSNYGLHRPSYPCQVIHP